MQRGRVLLQFRPWPPGWELPGGHCEPGEDPAVTAARETEEETGYRVRIAGIVGVYSWRGLRSAGDVVYLGEVIGGAPRRSLEVVGAAHDRSRRACREPCFRGSVSGCATRSTSPTVLPRCIACNR